MELMLLDAKSTAVVADELRKTVLEKLSSYKKIGFATTIQFINQQNELIEFIKANNFETDLGMARRGSHGGQILGCSVMQYPNVDVILYTGSGLFHPIALALQNEKPILLVNPEVNEVRFLDQKEIQKYKTELIVKNSLLKNAGKIGIIATTKYGQNRINDAIELKKKYESQGKKVYIIVYDTIDFKSLLNFPEVDLYINTACPGIPFSDQDAVNKPLIDIDEIKD